MEGRCPEEVLSRGPASHCTSSSRVNATMDSHPRHDEDFAPQTSIPMPYGHGAGAMTRCRTIPKDEPVESCVGRKRRSIEGDTAEHENPTSAGKLPERQFLPRQPPLGVVRQLCLEAAESRLLGHAQGC